MGCSCSRRAPLAQAATAALDAQNSSVPLLHAEEHHAISRTPNDSVKRQGTCRAAFIVTSTGRIEDHYDLDRKKLGEGSFGSVFKATSKSTNAVRAVKKIAKAHMKDVELFKAEVELMGDMDHPNIIKLHETFEGLKEIYLVMELCSGGELFDRIIEADHFAEAQAAIIMRQVLAAVFYMHRANVVHRDLKPENFLFQSKDPIEKALLKLIDFGMSTRCQQDQVLSSKVGTVTYLAPEVLSNRYNRQCDMWSCGVIMYVLLCGYPPFFGNTDEETLKMVRRGKYRMDDDDWANLSSDAKKLLSGLLIFDPTERCTAEQAFNHAWIQQTAPQAADIKQQANFLGRLRCFRSQSKFKKAALQIIACQLNEDEIAALRDTFMALDANGDGLLTATELKEGIARAGLSEIPDDLQQLMKDIDSNGSGSIDYSEFLAATLDKRTYLREDACWSAFEVFDRNGDGKISMDELKQVLGDDSVGCFLGDKTAAQLMQEVDRNGDGTVDFDEFMEMMRLGSRCAG